MERGGFRSLLSHYGRFAGLSPIQRKPMPAGKYIYREKDFKLKEVTRSEINKLIEKGFLKMTGRGYVNPKRNQPVGIVRTVHGRHYYIEDWYADMAKKLK